MTDPIADMLNRIKNAQAVSKEMVSMPYSSLKYEIAKMLKKENWIDGFEKKGRSPKKIIEIKLKYDDGQPAILGLKRISSPGRRIYSSSDKIKRVKSGAGMSVVSTPKGLMSGKLARNKKHGGEILFEIW